MRVGCLLLITLVIFTAYRLGILFYYYPDFSVLSKAELLSSLLLGMRIDVITILTFFGLPALVMIFPLKTNINKRLHTGLVTYWFIAIAIMYSILFGDFIYFSHVHRHISKELFVLGNDAGMLLDVLKHYWGALFLSLLFLAILAKVFQKINQTPLLSIHLSPRNFFIFIIIFVVFSTGVRGRIQGKPFGIVDAFTTSKTASGNLALNAIYTTYRSSSESKKAFHHTDSISAYSNTRALLSDPRFEFISEDYPLMRQLSTHNNSEPKHNIVIILLEGWSSIYIDSFRHNNFKVTPNFDRLAQEGIIYQNFFANGQRSIDGLTSLFTGIPRVAGLNILGRGLELSEISLIGNLAKQNGYQTLAMQSSKRTSFRIDAIARLAGFDDYYGAEDIPPLNIESSGKLPYFGAWDNDTFDFLHGKIEETKPPFLAFAFSSSTHVPFISPGKEWEQYPHNDNDVNGFLNTMYYADHALGNFMEKAKQSDWFDDTVFIFLADHTTGFAKTNLETAENKQEIESRNSKYENIENFRIPLLIYSPKLLRPKVDQRVASQADILPSLVDLMNWEGKFSTLSNSIFSENQGFAFLSISPVIGFVNEAGYLKHSLKNELENTINDEKATEQFLSAYQSLTQLIRDNQFFTNK